MTEDIEDLIQTLEQIREEEYPDIPEGLVREIVQTEYNSREERSKVLDRIDEKVESQIDEN